MSDNAPVMRVVEERQGAVLVLTLDQPARRNALSMPLRTALTAALERAQSDKGVGQWCGYTAVFDQRE